MLLDFLTLVMNVNSDQTFSVYPGKSNNPRDIMKGRTFRRPNVTRKILIGDIPALIKAALNMQTFCLGPQYARYVDNRLLFGDRRITTLPAYEVLIHDGFYGKPTILETEPDQEFLGFMLECRPFELAYSGPTNISQVLSPYSASPPKVYTFEWISIPMSHRDQRSFSRIQSPTRLGSINSSVHSCRI